MPLFSEVKAEKNAGAASSTGAATVSRSGRRQALGRTGRATAAKPTATAMTSHSMP